ncbi:hypothetical protein [Alteromonas sp. BMJM2]|uniref:hypothetical protein n=1 Tax=Alteromonas sp. BMJM2 TaxID=2954241 RepID=UPI0022B2AFF2|nr:hypothetical protein [Alteromonas sp. BMJM2]
MTTSQQILSAPKGAIYVWPRQNTAFYLRDLLRHLGRTDLKIKYLSIFFSSQNNWQGSTTPVVIDHYCWDIATRQEMDSIYEYKQWIDSKGLNHD